MPPGSWPKEVGKGCQIICQVTLGMAVVDAPSVGPLPQP